MVPFFIKKNRKTESKNFLVRKLKAKIIMSSIFRFSKSREKVKMVENIRCICDNERSRGSFISWMEHGDARGTEIFLRSRGLSCEIDDDHRATA